MITESTTMAEPLLPSASAADPAANGDEEDGARTKRDGSEEVGAERPRGIGARACGAMSCILPKAEALPWGTFAVLTVWSAIPPSCFIVLFTQMGFGEHIYYTTAMEIGEYAYGLALGLAAFIFLLYVLDADEWTNRFGSVFFNCCILAIACGIVLLVLLIADRFPHGMVCLFAVFHPLWLISLKLVFYRKKDVRTFVSWLGGPLCVVSAAIVVAWGAWVFSDPDNGWNAAARVVAAERTGCEPNYDDHPDCRKEPGSEETCFHVEKAPWKDVLVFPGGCDQTCTGVYGDCPNGFILWIGPVLIGMTALFLSFFCTFLRTEGTSKDALNFGAVWIFLIVAMWVTTSLAGTAAGVLSALVALTLASFVASAAFVAVSFSKEERKRNADTVFERVQKKYGKHLDVVRALFVVTCAPIVIVYFGLSMTNQAVRRIGIFPCSQPPGEDGDVFTTKTRKQVNVMKSWDRAKIYTFAIYWGIAFMTLQVIVSKLTTVFLSWIIEKTAGFGLAAITAIMCGVGVMMFLLPPVPGVPVYLTLGIVLPAAGHKSLGWAGSVLYCTMIGLVLKLLASALQQKGIGQNLSHYVKVRQFVGINSVLMKAMRLVLDKDGLSVPKVSILIGGPDWPTSVLCGIMGLSLPQIMLGTTPIVFLIFPTCLSGTLLYMASVIETDTGNPEFPWASTVSAITLSLTAAVQFGSMIVAAYYLEQTASKRAADVEAIPDDEDVKEADDRADFLKRCYREVTQWDVVPFFAKLLLQLSLGCIVASCYMVQFFSDQCFKPHSLTDTIDDNLGGKVSNLFLTLGWVAVGLFCASTLLVCLFQIWGKRKAHTLATAIVVSGSMRESPVEASSAQDGPEPC